jgi:hypothetical protein
MSTQSSVETLLVHVQLKLHLSFSVMNNSSNASSHQLMTTLVLVSDVDLKKQKQTLNFNVVELSLQKSVCGSASRESKKGCSSFRSSTISSHQC